MDFLSVLAVLWKRRLIFIPLLILSIVAALIGRALVKPTYEADGSVFLHLPASSSAGSVIGGTTAVNQNPISTIPASLITAGNIVSNVLNSDATRTAIGNAGLESGYVAGVDRTQGPILGFVVKNSSAAVAVATLARLLVLTDSTLRSLQSGVPATSQIAATNLRGAPTATKHAGSKSKVALTVGALGVLLSVAIALIADAWMLSRRPRRARPAAPTQASAHPQSLVTPPASPAAPSKAARTEPGANVAIEPTLTH